MRRVLVLVEGQTEEVFIKQVLGPALAPKAIFLTPTLLTTKRTAGSKFKGGVSTYTRARTDLVLLLGDTNATLVTTMLDYYGLPKDFPGMATRPPGDALQRVAHVESELARDVAHARFLPYLSLHEFEATIFSNVDACDAIFADRALRELRKVRNQFASPEHINDNPNTAPSKRIKANFPDYEKVVHGAQATSAIGLARIRAECAHFDAWVKRLEAA